VTISDRLAEATIDWQFLIDAKGLILHSLGRNKVPGDSISATGLYNIVQKRGKMIGMPELQPHDTISGAHTLSLAVELMCQSNKSAPSWVTPLSGQPRSI